MDCWTERESELVCDFGAVKTALMRAVFRASDCLMRSRTSFFVTEGARL